MRSTAQTEGNPLFLGEVVRLLAQEGASRRPANRLRSRLGIPQGVREAIGRRLGHLSEECNEILVLASILGREFRLDALERVSERSGSDILELLDQAFVAGLIVGGTRRARPSALLPCPRPRHTARGAEPESPRRTARARRRGARGALRRRHRSAPRRARLPLLRGSARRRRRARDRLRPARRPRRGSAARLRGGGATLPHGHRRAGHARSRRAHETRCELLLALGDAEARAGNMPEAKKAFLAGGRDRAPSGCRRHSRRPPSATAGGSSGRGPVTTLASSPSCATRSPACQSDSPLRVRLLARLAGALRDEPSPEARDCAECRSRRDGSPAGRPAHARVRARRAVRSHARPGQSRRAARHRDEIVRLADAVDDRERAVQGRHYRLIALLELGDLQSVDAEVAAMALLAEELRQPAQLWYVAATRANLALFTGRFDEAEDLIARALELGRHALSRDAALSSRLQLFLLRREQDRLGGDRGDDQTVNPGVPREAGIPLRARPPPVRPGSRDRPRAAFDQLAADEFRDIPVDNEWLFCMSLLADASERLGDSALRRACSTTSCTPRRAQRLQRRRDQPRRHVAQPRQRRTRAHSLGRRSPPFRSSARSERAHGRATLARTDAGRLCAHASRTGRGRRPRASRAARKRRWRDLPRARYPAEGVVASVCGT